MANFSRVFVKGELPIGDKRLKCYVLDDKLPNPTRLLLATSFFDAFDRPRKGAVTTTPAFMGSELANYAENQGKNAVTTPIDFMDGNTKRTGYKAELLPELCTWYLQLRRAGKLNPKQTAIADVAEILLESFAKVGIAALIDEATGFQRERDPIALQQLLNIYLAEGIKKWVKTFPNMFFDELDKLYENEKTRSQGRPIYYANFINKYIYEPLENGVVNNELDKRYIADNRRHRKHQHLTEFGSDQVRFQLGMITGLMRIAPNLKWFKFKFSRLGQLSLFPNDAMGD